MTSLNNLLVGPVARLPWRVQTKLLAAFLAIVALLIALGAIGLYELRAVNQRTEELIKSERKIAAYRQVQHDTPEVLKDYAEFWGAKPEGWSFLTGSLEAVREVTRRYGVFFAKKEDGSVEHSQLTSLVDADGQMRVQYLGARFDPEEFRRDLLSLVDKE